MLDYIGTHQRVGSVMLISLRHLQVEAGVSFDLLDCPMTSLPYLTDCWILRLRVFCAQSDISLQILRNKIPSISRIGDSMLMEKALTLGLTKQELIAINLVRIFLCVTTLSGIATADGTKLHSLSWQGKRIPDRFSRTSFARKNPRRATNTAYGVVFCAAFFIPRRTLPL